MPQLVLIQSDLTNGKQLTVRQKTFSNGFASIEIDICDKYSHKPDVSFFLSGDEVNDLIKFLTTEHKFSHDLSKI